MSAGGEALTTPHGAHDPTFAASMRARRAAFLLAALVGTVSTASPGPIAAQDASERPRARDVGVVVGIFEPGPLNAITDVAGVRVGHATVTAGDSVRTGVTAIVPHGGDVFHERVPAAVHVANAYGKLVGATQVRELGELETPILLTCTLCVWKAADAMAAWLLARPGMEDVRSVNAVVGETNDGYLNDIRARPIEPEHVVAALEGASEGPVEEGSVGAGTGTSAFGWKGGIGTSSRRLPSTLGGWTVGVLVQSNFGGVLTINGAPVGRALGRYAFQRAVEAGDAADGGGYGDGSVMIVVATDAPLTPRNLERLAARTVVGLARTGSSMSNGSGDFVLAFSTARGVRRTPTSVSDRGARASEELGNGAMSGLFQAVAEATEEAIYNSLFRATTVHGHRGTIEALPLDEVLPILELHGAAGRDASLPPRRDR
jgi:D-aminopeptidase